ncbi:MAG: hypothetical protein ACRDJY_11695 [Thermoleophilaceae bacterium]
MRKTIAVVAAVACVVPVLAFAAEPAKRTQFTWSEQPDSVSFKTNKTGTKLKQVSMYNKCASVPVESGYPKIPVNDEGKFSKSGKVTDVIGQELTFEIKGKFKKPRKAVGTFEIDSQKGGKRCDEDPVEFVAKPVEQ